MFPSVCLSVCPSPKNCLFRDKTAEFLRFRPNLANFVQKWPLLMFISPLLFRKRALFAVGPPRDPRKCPSLPQVPPEGCGPSAWWPPRSSPLHTSSLHTSPLHTSRLHTSSLHTLYIHTSCLHTSSFHTSSLHNPSVHRDVPPRVACA